VSVDMKKTIRFPEFHKAFVELKGEMTNKEFAEKLGMSTATVGFYAAGDRIPDALSVAHIANVCGVTADWLLGLSSVKERDADLQAICDYTHLSPEAVEAVRKVAGKGLAAVYIADFVNLAITHPEFAVFSDYVIGAALSTVVTKYATAEAQDDELEALATRATEFGFTLMPLQKATKLNTQIAFESLEEITKTIIEYLVSEYKKRDELAAEYRERSDNA